MGSGKSLGLTNVPSVNIAIDGSTLGIGCKQLSVDNAAVTLTGKQLILSGTYTPAAGEVFTIVSAPTGITGTFNGLPDGDTITYNDRSLVIHYTETAVTLTDAAPVVTSNPSPIGVNNGNVVTFSASASGIPAPSVHWQVNTGSGFVDMVSAQTSSTLTFLLKWAKLSTSKYHKRLKRYGKINGHNGKIPRDWWLEEWEKQSVNGDVRCDSLYLSWRPRPLHVPYDLRRLRVTR